MDSNNNYQELEHSHELCSLCHEPSHAPASCAERSFWLNITSDDLMKKRHLFPNCKLCPNCKTAIEKNGGCNSISCTNCHHEFCWMCGKDWKTHPPNYYECKDYKPEDDPLSISKELLEPYHDKFVHKEAENKLFLERINQNTDFLINKKVQPEPEIAENEKRKAIVDLLNEIYWARECLRWSLVHLFNLRYQVVKYAEIKDQVDQTKYPDTKEFDIFKLAMFNAEENIGNIVKDLLDESKNKISFNDIEKISKEIRLLRDSLLKQCNPRENSE